MTARSRACLTLLALLSCPAMVRAERPPLRVYTTADGLAHDSVNKIVRDSRGFLWFCTAEGLSRFDGFRFKNYTQEHGLPDRNVNDLVETRSGTLLIATGAGVSVFDPLGVPHRWDPLARRLEQPSPERPMFRTFVPTFDGDGRTRNVLTLVEDAGGRIWAGTGHGLFRLQQAGATWTFAPFALDGEQRLEIYSFVAEPSGALLVGSNGGLFSVGPDGRVERLVREPTAALFRDRDGRLWIDAGSELKVFHTESGRLRPAFTLAQKDGLPPHAIHFHVNQTSDGRIYVGFEYGFAQFLPDARPGESKFRVFEREKINDVDQDASGTLWIGTDTKGAWKLTPNGFTMLGEADGLSPSDEIMAVVPDREAGVYLVSRPNKLTHLEGSRVASVVPSGLAQRSWGWHNLDHLSRDGEWWIPGIDGLRRYPRVDRFADLARTPPKRVYTQRDGMFADEVFMQFEDSRGDLWFSVAGSIEDTLLRWERSTDRLVSYTTADGLPKTNGPIAFAEDRQGDVWFGYYFGGLARYRAGRFRLFSDADGMPTNQVLDLLDDSSGRLWIATSGRGLFRVDDTAADRPTFQSVSTANGLTSNQTLCLTEDRFGRVYAGTGHGINRIDRDGHVNVFTQEHGLPSNYVTRCAADRAGTLWFVTRNTLLRFVPTAEPRSTPAAVLIDRVLVNGVPRTISELGEIEPQPLVLASTERQIQVDFFALTPGSGTDVRYQYRLDEQDWSGPTTQHTLNLELGPGRRTLWIRAIDSAGAAGGRPARLQLRILPPFWLRWWFLASAGSLAAAVLAGFYRYRTARLREVNAALADARRAEEALSTTRAERLSELERVRARIATDLHDDIGSSLTQIAVLSEVARQKAPDHDGSHSIDRIITISNDLVDSMSDIVWAINPKKDHLSDLLQRMRRFASDVLAARQIAFTFRVPEADRDVDLGANVRREVFLIFKETINNVVRHAACTRVEIQLEFAGDDLHLRIADNGRGFEIDGRTGESARGGRGGNGLLNMDRRARDMGGRFEVVSSPGAGTVATLILPSARHAGTVPPTHVGGVRAGDMGHAGVRNERERG